MYGFNETCIRLGIGENCGRLTGYKAVYRLCLGMVAFSLLLMLITVCVPNSNQWRGHIHNGYVLDQWIIFIIQFTHHVYNTDMVTNVELSTTVNLKPK